MINSKGGKMNLAGKKLLLMGGGAFLRDIRSYADEKGFSLIGVGNDISRLLDKVDEAYVVDTQDVSSLCDLVEKLGIDGVFTGAAEINIPPAIELCERVGLPYYTTKTQWDTLSDKSAFKDLLRKHGLPVIPEYPEDVDAREVTYPVIVKPVDGSGAHGISVCRTALELPSAITLARQNSNSGRVIIEKYLEGMDDTFIRYHFQNGIYDVSSSFDKYSDFSRGGFTGMPVLYTHPTKHLDAYLRKFDVNMQQLFADLGLQNGMISLQGFVDENEDYYFYEAGYRLGGSQSYLFTDAVNGSNTLQYMVNYALTGQMADFSIAEKDDPHFTKASCCNLYVPLRAGAICRLDGVDELRMTDGILNVTQMLGVGDIVHDEGNLNQVCMRMHLMADCEDELDDLLAFVDDALAIEDELGRDMRMQRIRSVSDALSLSRRV